jgi:hypothetical protein
VTSNGPGVRDLVCFEVPALTDGPVWGIVQDVKGGTFVVDFGPVRTLVRIERSDVIEWRPRLDCPGPFIDQNRPASAPARRTDRLRRR